MAPWNGPNQCVYGPCVCTVPCTPGTYIPYEYSYHEVSSARCKLCEPGFYQDKYGQSECHTCSSLHNGSYVSNGATWCPRKYSTTSTFTRRTAVRDSDLIRGPEPETNFVAHYVQTSNMQFLTQNQRIITHFYRGYSITLNKNSFGNQWGRISAGGLCRCSPFPVSPPFEPPPAT